MEDVWKQILRWWTHGGNASLGRAVLILVVGLFVARAASAAVQRLLASRASAQHEMIGRRATMYGIVIITLIAALHELGFDLSVLVGAAGILTVAIGFASKTAASNIISGMFLMGEKPFVLGDTIAVGSTSGEVVSIDLLSVKLRTFDNRLVRIPNESMLTMEVVNVSQYPIRRFDLELRVAYGQDITQIRKLLLDLADNNNLCLDSPAPAFHVTGIGESGVQLMFAVWAARENYLAMRNSIVEQTAQTLTKAGIEPTGLHRRVVVDTRPAAVPAADARAADEAGALEHG